MVPASIPLSPALAPRHGVHQLPPAVLAAALPPTIHEAGTRAAFHSVEFFTARLRNPHTRAAYGRAVTKFCAWCEARGIPLPALSSPIVAAYYDELVERLSPASANQHLSGIRQWLEWLSHCGVLPFNPAAAVRGTRVRQEEGKTPVLNREEARRLFASLEASSALIAQRDRAILAVMLYDFVRVSAVVRMRVRDFRDQQETAWLMLREKGGRERRLPAHHVVREYIRGYLEVADLGRREHAGAPLFQSAPGAAAQLSGRPLDRSSVLAIVKRRCHQVGFAVSITGRRPAPRRSRRNS
jgi:site-specific recombinase XerD